MGCSHFLFPIATFDVIVIWIKSMKLCYIEALIDAAGDGLNFSNKLVLNVLQVVTVIRSYQIDGQTQVAKTP